MAKDTTQEQFAKLVGITQPQVSQLIRKGVLSRKATIGEWLQDYLKNLREQAAGRQSPDSEYDLIGERARLAARQSEKIEIDIARQHQELIPTQALLDAMQFLNTTIRSKLLAIPRRFKSLWPDASTKEITILDGLVREALTELAHVRLPPDIRRQAEQHFSQLSAAAKPDGKRVGGRALSPEP